MKKLFLFIILTLVPNVSLSFEKTTNFDLKKLFEIQKSGKTIVINSWNKYCSTCAAQTKVFDHAMKEFKAVADLFGHDYLPAQKALLN